MISTPQVVSTDAMHVAFIHVVCARSEIKDVMGPGITEVFGVLAAQGIKPAGAWFCRHYRITETSFDFDICVPLTTPVRPAGRVESGIHPAAAKVAKAVYRGDFSGLPGAWGELHQWIAQQGFAYDANLWEAYVLGPESSPNPADWITELYRPLKS